jgi:ATP-dependent Clp protease ATP-binding subunit ClpA
MQAPIVGELFAAAQVEAIAFRHDSIGTEHVLLGLVNRADEVGEALRELGLELASVRREIRGLVGEGPTPEAVFDADALAAVGVDLAAVRARVEATFGEGSLERARRAEGRCRGAAAFGVSPRLKQALESARCAAAENHRELSAADVLLGLARQRGSVGARILEAHGITPARIDAAHG